MANNYLFNYDGGFTLYYLRFLFFILTFETCVCKICSGAVIWRRLVLLVLPETKVSPVRPEFSPEEDYAYEY